MLEDDLMIVCKHQFETSCHTSNNPRQSYGLSLHGTRISFSMVATFTKVSVKTQSQMPSSREMRLTSNNYIISFTNQNQDVRNFAIYQSYTFYFMDRSFNLSLDSWHHLRVSNWSIRLRVSGWETSMYTKMGLSLFLNIRDPCLSARPGCQYKNWRRLETHWNGSNVRQDVKH